MKGYKFPMPKIEQTVGKNTVYKWHGKVGQQSNLFDGGVCNSHAVARKHLCRLFERNDAETISHIFAALRDKDGALIKNQLAKRYVEEWLYRYKNIPLRLVLDCHTFAVLIRAYGSIESVSMIAEMLTLMQEYQVAHNSLILNALIEAYGNTKQAVMIERMLELLPKQRIVPDVITISSLMTASGNMGCESMLNKALALMQQHQIKHNRYTVTALIAAYVQFEQWAQAVEFLQQVILNQRMYTHSLGYNSELNTIDFHADAIFDASIKEEHIPGIPLPLAKVIFIYHLSRITESTKIIVGCHGKGILKEGMLSFIPRHGWSPEVSSRNPGVIILRRVTHATPVPSIPLVV